MSDYIDTNISVVPYIGANGNVGWGIQRHADGRMFNFVKICWTRDHYTVACWGDDIPMNSYRNLLANRLKFNAIEDDMTLYDKAEYRRRAFEFCKR